MSFSNLDQLYRQVIMDHYQNPRNHGTIDDDAVTIHMNNPTCGDRIELHLQVDDGKVTDVKFTGEGCSISLSSASMMTDVIKGLPVEDALKLSQTFSEMIQGKEYNHDKLNMGDAEALQGVSKFPARIRCATLAWKAMEQGLQE